MSVNLFPNDCFDSWFVVWKDEKTGEFHSTRSDNASFANICQSLLNKIGRGGEKPRAELANVVEKYESYLQSVQSYLKTVYEESVAICPYKAGDIITLNKPYMRNDKARVLEILGAVGNRDGWGIDTAHSYALKCVMLKKDGSDGQSIVSVSAHDIKR